MAEEFEGVRGMLGENGLLQVKALGGGKVCEGVKSIVGEFEASTHDWAADEKAVSGEDVEMIPAEEFFKDAE